MSDDGMKIDFGDGALAFDRLMRSIVMMTDGAIGKLVGLGYSRDEIFVKVHEGGLPVWIDVHDERVFSVEMAVEDGKIIVKGDWLTEVSGPKPKRGFFARLLGR